MKGREIVEAIVDANLGGNFIPREVMEEYNAMISDEDVSRFLSEFVENAPKEVGLFFNIGLCLGYTIRMLEKKDIPSEVVDKLLTNLNIKH